MNKLTFHEYIQQIRISNKIENEIENQILDKLMTGTAGFLKDYFKRIRFFFDEKNK